MEVQTVQSVIQAPPGQKGGGIIRRPQASETAVDQSFQAKQGYGYAPAPNAPAPAPDSAEAPIDDRMTANPSNAEPRESPDQWAQRYAQLSRRERELHQYHQKTRERERALSEREARIKEFEGLMDLRQKDPKAFVEKNGLSYEQLTDIYIGDGKPTPEHHISALEKKIQDLEERLNKDKQSSEESWANDQINGFKRNIRGVIDQNGERFELIQAEGAHDLVFDVIQNYFKETKEVLPIHEAANFVEEQLFEEGKRIAGLKKFQQLREPKPSQESFEEPQNSMPQRSSRPQSPSRSQTITSGGFSGGVMNSLEERKRNAARMLRFNNQR